MAHPSHHPKRHLDRFSRFRMGLNAMLYNALSVGKKTPKIAPSPWYFVTHRSRTDPRAWVTCIKIGKDHTCDSADMLADRQTDTHRRAHYNTSPPLPQATSIGVRLICIVVAYLCRCAKQTSCSARTD